MGQALYRRYRSKNLAEIVGQDHITTTLKNTIDKGAIGHAYLLTGPRGVGKTSIARILAHEINELPYEAEKIHLDIIEIDAASNRRIDEIRDLRDKVHTAPSSAKYKVYIIDEVHMLTKEAFNALLKTLEEPPQHVIFILATTDVHKLPETIISRTQHFTFKPIPSKLAEKHLAAIAKQEGMKIETGALELLAKHGRGSFRDSIGLLEQASNISKNVTTEEVRDMLGVPPAEKVNNLVRAFLLHEPKDIVAALDELLTAGYIAEEIANQITEVLRQKLLNNEANTSVHRVLRELLDVPSSADPAVFLELVLLTNSTHPTTKLTKVALPPPQITKPKPLQKNKPKNDSHKTEKDTVGVKDNTKPATNTKNAAINSEAWDAVLAKLKATHSTLYSVARMAHFTALDNEVTLSCQFPFHKKRLDTSKYKTVITDAFNEVCGISPILQVEVVQVASEKTPTTVEKEAKPESIETISNIFGGAEVLES
jgi:DNA polymerase III subunit gamma/tau